MLLTLLCERYFVKFDKFFQSTQNFLLYSSTVFINEIKYKRKCDNCEQKFKTIHWKQQHLKICRIKLKKQTRRRLNENILFINNFVKNDNVIIEPKIKSIENNEIIN